ncbi:MAG: hypothetical protein IIZ47_02990, partial [Erysipelotrichaceae bacterium]|nr:hypothetical protein [Erysipelotrichaceae bacterium]
MKKLLKVLLCLVLVFSLAPRNEAKAEYGTVTNVRIDANGTMTWDAYPGATEYAIVYTEDWSGYFFVSTNSADLPLELGRETAKSGTYNILVQALNEEL